MPNRPGRARREQAAVPDSRPLFAIRYHKSIRPLNPYISPGMPVKRKGRQNIFFHLPPGTGYTRRNKHSFMPIRDNFHPNFARRHPLVFSSLRGSINAILTHLSNKQTAKLQGLPRNFMAWPARKSPDRKMRRPGRMADAVETRISIWFPEKNRGTQQQREGRNAIRRRRADCAIRTPGPGGVLLPR